MICFSNVDRSKLRESLEYILDGINPLLQNKTMSIITISSLLSNLFSLLKLIKGNCIIFELKYKLNYIN